MDWRTHDVSNQIPEYSNYNLLASDVALTEALDRTAAWSSEKLSTFGGLLGERKPSRWRTQQIAIPRY